MDNKYVVSEDDLNYLFIRMEEVRLDSNDKGARMNFLTRCDQIRRHQKFGDTIKDNILHSLGMPETTKE